MDVEFQERHGRRLLDYDWSLNEQKRGTSEK